MVSFTPSMHRYLLMLTLFTATSRVSDCYDPLDPNGNITVTFDVLEYNPDGYVARVTIQNYYQYRHVEKPGWKLGWTWSKEEVILSMNGAVATKQGDCKPTTNQKPHCCLPDPVVVDLMPDGPDNRTDGCCRGGLLSAWSIDPSTSHSSFEITIGNLGPNNTAYRPPLNLTLMAPGPGYTCGPIRDTSPSVSSVIGGIREEQVFKTWKSACTYSSYLSSKTPVCCVSLSTFYNPYITPCPSCSCGCRIADQSANSCISEGAIPSNIPEADLVKCTDHMCPLRIHWHIKNNYVTHWKVKLTVSNYHYGRNYSDWNVVVQHPGFGQSLAASEFNTTMLPTNGIPGSNIYQNSDSRTGGLFYLYSKFANSSIAEDVALFWGKALYNTELLQSDQYQLGSVTTDILLQKDAHAFTLSNGWALPRRVYFNGENCQMPLPDTFPALPNDGPARTHCRRGMFLLLTLLYFTCTMFVGC